MNKKIIFSIGAVSFLLLGIFIFSNNNERTGQANNGVASSIIAYINNSFRGVNFMNMDEVASRVIDYINNNFEGINPNLVSVTEESGLYKIVLEINGNNIDTFASKDGKLFFPEAMMINGQVTEGEPVPPANEVIGGFGKVSDTPCLENGKPIMYYFGTSTCPFCTWQTPVIERVAELFKDNVVTKIRLDTEEDRDIFSNYSEGGVPLIVIGCQYSRVGAGTQWGEEQDINYISALNCKLTNNQPANVCDPLQDLINSI